MKKLTFLATMLLCCMALVAQESTILFADFENWTETGSEAFTSRGWTVIEDENPDSKDKWEVAYSDKGMLSGFYSATAGAWDRTERPNDEWLITPEIDLTNEAAEGYCLDFLWESSINACNDSKGCFRAYVKVKVVGTDTWDTVFDLANQEMVELSGVKWPWTGWSINNSVIDLTAYKGKKINIGFHYHELSLFDAPVGEEGPGYGGNSFTIDNVTVKERAPLVAPVVETVNKDYKFTSTYIGTVSASGNLSLKNVGIGELEVLSVEGLDGTDFSCSLVPHADKAKKNEEILYRVFYTPTLMGKAAVTMTIHTNGGDVEVALSGSKIMIPAGYTYQGFEGTWLPAGWTLSGEAWRALNGSFSGNKCAVGTSNVTAGESWLTSPRMDLSDGGTYNITFDFYEAWDQLGEENANYPDNGFIVEFSEDAGHTWVTVYDQDKKQKYNERVRFTYTVSGSTSDSCYVRFGYIMDDELDTENIDTYDFSILYLDDVVLPPLYGANNAPGAATVVSPTDKATNVTYHRPVLSWNEVQFANTYKVNLGTQSGTWDVLNGAETTELSMTAPLLDYNTTYYWQVVAVNANGTTENASVWSFTTMDDQTVRVFPWFEGFENCVGRGGPLGWEIITNDAKTTRWECSINYTYEGKAKMSAFGITRNTETSLCTPEIVLPADDEMQLSFFWGNGMLLSKETTGAAINTTTEPDDVDACYAEIEVDGEWHTLGLISMKSEYFNREVFDLSPYKGKTVVLRWRYKLIGKNWRGVSLDNISIASKSGVLAYFNVSEWAAGMINYGCQLSSDKQLSLINGGTDILTIDEVTTALPKNFTCDLQSGSQITPNGVLQFAVTVHADSVTAGEYKDTLIVTFTNGQFVELPLSFTSLAKDMLYFNFEQDAHGSLNPKGLTTYDKDGYANRGSSGINWPNKGAAYAYCVINVDADHSDWRNVYPISGNQVLSASAPNINGSGYSSDWVISPQLKATEQSEFSFYGKSYGTDDEYNDFTPHYYEIWISTTDDNINSFQQIGTRQQISRNDAKWYQYKTDLSKYNGQNIYIALVHCANADGYIAFFDDFMYSHFDDASKEVPGGLQYIKTDDTTVRKVIMDGQLYILRGDKVYNVMGVQER